MSSLILQIHFVKKANSQNNSHLKTNGIEELLDLLPPLPRRWTKQMSSQPRNATSLPISMQLKANPDLMKPVPSPRTNKGKAKKPTSMYSPSGIDLKPAIDIINDEADEVSLYVN